MKHDYSWLTGPTSCMMCHKRFSRRIAIAILEKYRRLLCDECETLVSFKEASLIVNFEDTK